MYHLFVILKRSLVVALRLLKHTYHFFTWLRSSLKRDGVSLHLRYQSYVFYISVLFDIYGMSKREAHQLLKMLIVSSLPQIHRSRNPRIAYETVIELCFLLFRSGLGTKKCIEYRISRGHIINRFEEYSESNIGYLDMTNEITDYLERVVFRKRAIS
jgi:hypothetical protein